MEDIRGVRRGCCTLCGCAAYDGGNAGKKCLDCNHPPGKHQNLDVLVTNSSVEDITPAKSDQSGEAATTSISLESISLHELELSPSAVEEESDRAEHSVCWEIEEKNHQEAELCPEDEAPVKEPMISIAKSIESPQSWAIQELALTSSNLVSVSPIVPSGGSLLADSERCCYRDCNRLRFKDKDKTHPFCSRKHANLYQQESLGMQCNTVLR